MTRIECIEKFRKEIEKKVMEYYEQSLRCGGRLTYSIYMYDDGTFEVLPQIGSSGYLQKNEWEERELYFLADVKAGEEDLDIAMIGYNESERDEAIENFLDWFREESLPCIMEEMEEENQ